MPLKALIDSLREEPHETEWLEFKCNNKQPELIGKYLSALSNSACIENKKYGYLLLGIDDETHAVVGTSFKPRSSKGKGNEDLEPWLARLLSSHVHFKIFEYDYNGMAVVIFRVDATTNIPVRFNGHEYIRVGSTLKSLADYQERAKLIWNRSQEDWSAQAVNEASLDDLDSDAFAQARESFKEKHQNDTFYREIDEWDDWTFLRKAGLATGQQLNRTAILLLGKPESAMFLTPHVAQISWILKGADGIEMDYQHFAPPFLSNVNRLFARIRNLTLRELPGGTLFPVEISQYDEWVVREALHNCIAHQDYILCSRIIVVEQPDELLFVNAGRFIPGSIETVLQQNAPQKRYPNRQLAESMVHLNMIDTIGSGIRRMFAFQKKRYMPMPDFDLTAPDEVQVRIAGRILDENYSKLLMKQSDLSLSQVILLDKVQKRQRISKEDAALLRTNNLVEGRYPNLFVAAELAALAGEKSKYILNKGLDDEHYIYLILQLIQQYGSANRNTIDDLIRNKLPAILTDDQKDTKISNLLQRMRKRDLITNAGARRSPEWILSFGRQKKINKPV
jgi:ATP-dependent DNA helicase RecG